MANERNTVILVDESDRSVGVLDKLEAHRGQGRLHRAISVFIYDGDRMLLQRRPLDKPLFGGLWSNACCTHPQPHESVEQAAHTRLMEELGFDTELKPAGTLLYSAFDPISGMSEREFDHLFVGRYSGPVRPNLSEVRALEWATPREILAEIAVDPKRYTPWFKQVIERIIAIGEGNEERGS